MVDERTSGRRERKRAATRQAISDAALELFLARGFDSVSVNEVAQKADVATATLFNHFPNKESLLFDRDDTFDIRLAEAVRGRPTGMTILQALRERALAVWVPLARDPKLAARRQLIAGTPALRAYDERSWLQHSDALAAVIAAELGRPLDDLACVTLARYFLDIAILTADREDVEGAVRIVFDMLEHGWNLEG
ncbi:TetR/AcrR family transcriptional regulator [Leifsonia sp. NPDC058292]|uniref:TetR/AcrR family transcriptional regulator n=1 Tax=Leifsonia sp. NPDC058292 TaxID=3346428 RepID=UPI0036DA67DF